MPRKRWNPPRNLPGTSKTPVPGEHCDVRPGLIPGTAPRGRGAALNPGNRFETVRLHVLGDQVDEDQRARAVAEEEGAKPQAAGASDAPPAAAQIAAQVFADQTRHIIHRVQTPSIGFDWTLNPYRGCEHGCIYCYARPYHEYLGFSSGIDFETKIMAKFDAPELLRRELAQPKWTGETIVMSAITDCWQPLEEKLRLARACLEVLATHRQPVSLLTRNVRLARDLDLLRILAQDRAVHVSVSLTTLDNSLSALMEPRASAPRDRLRLIRELTDAHIPVTVMLCPVIPGLTDREIPHLLAAAADAGARNAHYDMVRLPYQNKELFLDWLHRHFPLRAKHIETLLREAFEGKLYDSAWEKRGRGTGALAQQVRDLFRVYARKYHLDKPIPPLNTGAFHKPTLDGQLRLF